MSALSTLSMSSPSHLDFAHLLSSALDPAMFLVHLLQQSTDAAHIVSASSQSYACHGLFWRRHLPVHHLFESHRSPLGLFKETFVSLFLLQEPSVR